DPHLSLSDSFFSCSRAHVDLHSFPTRRSSDLGGGGWDNYSTYGFNGGGKGDDDKGSPGGGAVSGSALAMASNGNGASGGWGGSRSEEHTSELQSRENLVCRLLLEKKKEERHNP